jgi:hypothetical protein
MAWDWLENIPGVNIVNDLARGNWEQAAKNAFTGGLYGPGENIYNGVKSAINAPYEEKHKGIETIQQELQQLKKERMARMDQVYGKADAKFDDTRAAMKQLYGDPTGWKL